jgi:transcriptional regulator with XRE-family HTH domain
MASEQTKQEKTHTGQRIKMLRERLKLQQNELARALDILPSSLCAFEKGERNPTYEFLARIAAQYSVNLNWLVIGKGEIFTNRRQNENSLFMNLDFGEQTQPVIRLIKMLNDSPLVRLTILAFAAKFMLANENLINKDIKLNKEKNKSKSKEDKHEKQ